MSVSSAGQGLRPGVVTSTTRPTTPYTGQVIYEVDTGYLRVWDGSAWDYLSQSQDTTEGLPAETYMGLVKVIPTSVTNGTLAANGTVTVGNAVSTVTVGGAWSSLYNNYRVIISGVDASVGATSMFIRFDAGGTTNYYSSVYYDQYTGTDTATLRRNAQASGGIGVAGAENETSISIDVYLPYATNRTTWSGTHSAYGYQGWCGGTTGATTSYTDFTILPNSGTLTGGSIRVYGYRN